jgi:hypothetical protein
MSRIEVDDGAFQVDSAVVARGLKLEPSSVRAMMRNGEITCLCERGVNEDAGRYRLTFFHESRQFRILVDANGVIIRRTTIDFSDHGSRASMRKRNN